MKRVRCYVPKLHTDLPFLFPGVRVGGGVLASDMCLLSSNHLFLASNLGDSQVIKFEEAGNAQNGAAVPDVSSCFRVDC